MSAHKRFGSVFGKQRVERRQTYASFYRRKLRCERLEDRRLLAVITVNTFSDTTNLNDTFTTLREAIFAANLVAGADEIKFAPPETDSLTHTIVLKEGEIKIADSLTITGLGQNVLTVSAAGNDTTPEVKDGKGSRIFNIMGPKEGERINVSIKGLKLTGGDTTAAGGAISSMSANLTITGSTITGNAAAFAGGGGLYHSNGNLSIIESSISGNSAGTINAANGAPGGGVFINHTAFSTAGPTVQIRGSEIANNTATGDGGGIAVQGFTSAVTITESHISGNKSTVLGSGGGMRMTAGARTFPTLTTEHVTFDHNTASTNATGGGGLAIFGVNAIIARSDFTANSGGRSGGGIFAGERSTLKLSNSTISNNTAAITGGGVAGNVTSALSPTNGFSFTGNTFVGNSTTNTGGDSRGGGLWLAMATAGTTTISGNTFRENTSATGGGAALQLNSTSAQLVIDDSQFNGNRANGPSIATGGGLHLSGSGNGVTIRKTSFENNLAQSTQATALGQGGGVFSMLPKLTIEDSRFAANKAGLQGGGIALSGGATITGTEILGNAAQGTKGLGGGIYLTGSSSSAALLVTDSTISGNTATLNGGGAYLSSGSPAAQFERVKFNENSATQDGGAISATAREVVLRSSTISKNTAGRDGGGLSTTRSATFVVNSSTINNNTAGRNGGGASIIQSSGSLRATNSTFSANRATNNGGGLYSDSGATLAHSTFFQNRADQIGGGVFLAAGTGSIRNTVIAGNTAPLGRDISGLLGVTLNLHYSLIGSNQNSGLTPAPVSAPDANGNMIGGSSLIDPRLGVLTNNGGPTATHLPQSESPLINRGDPSAVAGQQDVPQFDQRGTGFPRVARGRLDIGAVELPPIIIAGDFDANGTVGAADFLLWRKTNGTTADLDAWRANFGASQEPAAPDSTNDEGGSTPVATSTRSSVPRRPHFASAQYSPSSNVDESALLGWVAEQSRSRPAAGSADWSLPAAKDSSAADNASSRAFDEAFAGLGAG